MTLPQVNAYRSWKIIATNMQFPSMSNKISEHKLGSKLNKVLKKKIPKKLNTINDFTLH